MDAPGILGGGIDNVLVQWRKMENAICYELLMRTLADHESTNDDIEWVILSSKVKGISVRKINLLQSFKYQFRVRCKFESGWGAFSPPSEIFTPYPSNTKTLSPPTFVKCDSSSITVEWENPNMIENFQGYEIKYRMEDDLHWTLVTTVVSDTIATKKSLSLGKQYYFCVRPVVKSSAIDNNNSIASEEHWEFSESSSGFKCVENSSAKMVKPACGFTTLQGREDWCKAHGISDKNEESNITKSLVADRDMSAPLYYWQIFSLTGKEPIYTLVTAFYESVFNDTEAPWFRDVFANITDEDHHIHTQASFWMDAMGGGSLYHGGDTRLTFHHLNNAKEIMTAEGATRWMYHMKVALRKHKNLFDAIDRRIIPSIIDFVRTKMLKYSTQHNWIFSEDDFVNLV